MNYKRFLEVSGPTEQGQLETWCRNRSHPTPEAGFNDWWENSYTATDLRATYNEYESYSKTYGRKVAPFQTSDNVESPKHYEVVRGLEAIDVIRKTLTPEEFRGYCIGNILKYRLRAGNKDATTQEIAKANKYKEWANGKI